MVMAHKLHFIRFVMIFRWRARVEIREMEGEGESLRSERWRVRVEIKLFRDGG